MTDLALAPPVSSYAGSLRRYRFIGLALIAAFGIGLVAWSSSAPLSSAVIAGGRIEVDGSTKSVQHETGGTVSEILVREGARVQQGDVLVRLDPTTAKAGLDIVAGKLDELWMTAARLQAERDGQAQLELPVYYSGREQEPAVEALRNTEQRLLTARLATRVGQQDQLTARIGQFESQIAGLETQQAAKARELALSTADLTSARALLDNGITTQSEVNLLERQFARLEGEAGQIAAEIAELGGRIAETRLQILNVDQGAVADAGRELSDTTSTIAELSQRRLAAADQLNRTAITAPITGVVQQLSIHTVGGVIGAGEVLMTVVPSDGTLAIAARINPADIEAVQAGQQATIRLPGLNNATTPELVATVRLVGADLNEDPVTRLSYYPVTLDLDAGEAERLGDVVLMPGMPVEAFITGTPRTFLDYLMQPIRDRLPHALRE
ncbi:MAG: HlyD family type I secretion periplasmic adaptor subunit [Devosia sp.]